VVHYTADGGNGCESYLVVALDGEPIADSPFMLRGFGAEFATSSMQKLPHAIASKPLHEPQTIRARVSSVFCVHSLPRVCASHVMHCPCAIDHG
jgi:hypothetical protein